MIPPGYTPEDLRFLSNLGHWAVGLLLGTASAILLLEALGYWRKTRVDDAVWRALLIVAGIFLPLFIFFHYGLQNLGPLWDFVRADRQQREHLAIAGLLVVSGLAESHQLLRGRHRMSERLVWPLALVATGIVLFAHPHAGGIVLNTATVSHHIIGGAVILAGGMKVVKRLQRRPRRWISIVSALLLLGTGILLLGYREPADAFEHAEVTPALPSTSEEARR